MGWKILVIEDDLTTVKMLQMTVFSRDPRFIPISASSIEEAEEAFARHPDIAGISVDGHIPSDIPSVFGEPNTLALVRSFKKTFPGPIIAASGSSNNDLCEAGCTHWVEGKFDICKKFSEIFTQTPPATLMYESHGQTAQ